MINSELNQRKRKFCYQHFFLKKKQLFLSLIILTAFLFFSCEREYDLSQSQTKTNTTSKKINARIGNGFEVVDGIIEFNNKEILQMLGDNYKASVEGQNNFNNIIRDLQLNGFKPLTPIFEEKDNEKIIEFIKSKRERLTQLELDLGIKSQAYTSNDIKLEDEIIADPFFASLLNEKREIVIGEIFYKYTELGLYYCNKYEKKILFEYLDNLLPSERVAIITKNRNIVGSKTGNNEFSEIVGNGITHFTIIAPPKPTYPMDGGGDDGGGYGGGGYSGGSGNGSVTTPVLLNTLTLNICSVDTQGFFEGVFGASEDCYVHFSDNRRTKTSFWNQNFHVYSAIGSSISLEKRNVIKFLWMSTVYWDNSFADKMEMGVNTINYKYNFNVPMYNQAQFNYSDKFFEYNGTKYNINGQVIPTVPTGKGSFIFDTDSNQNVLDITVLGYNQLIDQGQANNYIDQAVNQIINSFAMPQVQKQQLASDKANGNLKVNILYAVPFSNYVKFITNNVAWRENNAHRIVHNYDFNFLFTWKNTYSGYGDYLGGLNGATSYTEVKADIYGAALHNNEWRGSRLTYQQ